MNLIKPMRGESVKNIRLAGKPLKFPFFASSKIDGIRNLNGPSRPQTKQGYTIPNHHVRELLTQPEFVGFDGELTAGDLYDQELCAKTQSAVMAFDGQPDFCLWLFDDFSRPDLSSAHRNERLFDRFMKLQPRFPFLRYLEKRIVTNEEELNQAIEDLTITEGVMLQQVNSRYKFGKSTVNSQELVKFKPYEDAEAEIIGVFAGTTNKNQQVRNPLGGAKRSSAAAGKVETDMAGAFRCRNSRWGDFDVSLGTLSHEQRRLILANAGNYLGKICTFTYLPVGSVNKPRSPAFKLIRDPRV